MGKLRPENIENCVHVKALLDSSSKTASFQHTVILSHHQFPMLLYKIICLLMIAFPSNFTLLCCSTVQFPISSSTRLVGSLLWCHLSGWGKCVVGKRRTYVLNVQESHGWCTSCPHVLLIIHTQTYTHPTEYSIFRPYETILSAFVSFFDNYLAPSFVYSIINGK